MNCIFQVLVEGKASSRTAILNRPHVLNALNYSVVSFLPFKDLYFLLLFLPFLKSVALFLDFWLKSCFEIRIVFLCWICCWFGLGNDYPWYWEIIVLQLVVGYLNFHLIGESSIPHLVIPSLFPLHPIYSYNF